MSLSCFAPVSCSANVHKEIIVKSIRQVAPQVVFLLGTRKQQFQTESIFRPSSFDENGETQYLFLILLPTDDKASCYACHDKLENSLEGVDVIVLPVNLFHQWASTGNYFAKMVIENAECCYTAKPIDQKFQCAEIFQPSPVVDDNSMALRCAPGFIAAAELLILRRQFTMAAFQLHQATEQLLTYILRNRTGWPVQTHNLERLYKYCLYIEQECANLFPLSNTKDKKLLRLLQEAYSGARYKKEYVISCQDTEQLLERVKALLRIAENVSRI